MSLTVGTGPFGPTSHGRFNFKIPRTRGVIYFESFPRRIRGRFADEVTLAESQRARALFETGLPTRWYFSPEDVRLELLTKTDEVTGCAYKGWASYFSVNADSVQAENIAWTYPEPLHDGQRIKDRVCFFNERVDIEVDGETQPRPETQWSH